MENKNQDRACSYVGVEASANELIAICLADDNVMIASEREPVESLDASVPQLIDFIERFRSKYDDIKSVGIAVPGLIRRETSRVAYSARIPSHAGIDIANEIRTRTGLDALIENDANSAGYAEYKQGAGRGSRHMFYATIGIGVGGALIVDGRIWHGAAGFAGEFGYIAVNSDGMRLEEVASGENIVRRTRARLHQDSTSSLHRLNEQSMSIGDILTASVNDDDFARLMLKRTGNYIGSAVASVINLLNIETIVIGGPTMLAGNVLLNSIVRSARELSFTPSFESTLILAGELGDLAAATGVAILASEKAA
ncbi:MAG TPA: ROK family protein [Pyrinomonadaceae bacterium]|nr:ROK family protein [Pyrinomonadaceae bacterium]